MIGVKEEQYYSLIIRNNLFLPIVNAFKRNKRRYNLLNSALIEFFEFIRQVRWSFNVNFCFSFVRRVSFEINLRLSYWKKNLELQNMNNFNLNLSSVWHIECWCSSTVTIVVISEDRSGFRFECRRWNSSIRIYFSNFFLVKESNWKWKKRFSIENLKRMTNEFIESCRILSFALMNQTSSDTNRQKFQLIIVSFG